MTIATGVYYVDEDSGSAQSILFLSNPSSIDITVEVFSTDRSATGEYCNILINTIMVATGRGVDYISGPYTVTFPAGQTTATFNVQIIDDDILEGTETFMLNIDETSLPTGITHGIPSKARVIIVNDDCK